LQDVLAELQKVIRDDALVISIAAGVSSKAIEKDWAQRLPCCRTMPNTPMLVGEGMVAMAPGTHATPSRPRSGPPHFCPGGDGDRRYRRQIGRSLPPEWLRAGVFFFLVEPMVQAGIEMGLTPRKPNFGDQNGASGAKMLMTSPILPPSFGGK